MKRLSLVIFSVLILGCLYSPAMAVTKYWDINSDTPGAGQDGGGFTDGDWNTTATNWSTSAAGDVDTSTTPWVAGEDAVFSAGSDAVDAAVTVGAGVNPASLTVEDGILRLVGSPLGMGVNPVRVNQGATLEIPVNTIIGAAAGNVLTLDGGTIRNTTIGIGSGVYPSTGTQIHLTSNGGTIDTPNGGAGQYSIMLYNGVMGMTAGTTSATLTKKGPSEFRALTDWTFTAVNVQEGLYRINGAGGSDTGFGNPNGTVTVAGGAVAGTTQGAALGTTANLTSAGTDPKGPSPATRSFVLAGPGSSMFVLNNNWIINGPISGPGGLMLGGWVRGDTNASIGLANALTLGGTNTYAGPTTINFGTVVASGGSAIPNSSSVVLGSATTYGATNFTVAVLRIDASETIGSLAGGAAAIGSANINGPGVTLTTGADNSSTTLDGAITGTGGLTKIGTGTFAMNGVKTYSGDTKVEGGVLSTNSVSLADAADVYLLTGSTFNLNFAGPDVIDSLFFNGVSQAVGTWGGVGSGAANISALLSGTGLLQVSTLVSGGVFGDYNDNGVVDAADYSVWRDKLGQSTTIPHDSTPGMVTSEDYTVWKTNFGMAAPGGGSLSAGAVPEPSSLMLVICSLAGLHMYQRRR